MKTLKNSQKLSKTLKNSQKLSKISLILTFCFVIVQTSCKKELIEKSVELKSNPSNLLTLEVQDGILKFNNKKQLSDLLDDNKNPNQLTSKISNAILNGFKSKKIKLSMSSDSLASDDSTNNQFKSYYEIYVHLDSLATYDEAKFNLTKVNYPDVNCDDAISEDFNFSKVVNIDKEIIVGDTLYKICNDGVLTVGKDGISEYLSKSKKSKIDGLKLDYSKFNNAIFYYNKDLNHKINLSYKDPNSISNIQNFSNETPSNGIDPNANIETFTYSNKREYKNFPQPQRRLKVLFWSRDWIAYKSIGVKVVIQKQTSRFFNWWGSVSNHNYVKAYLTNFRYRINQKDFFTPQGVFNTSPSLGSIGSQLVSRSAKIALKKGIEYYSFSLRDLIDYNVVTDALGIPRSWINEEQLMYTILNEVDKATSKKIFAELDKVLPPTFQEKKFLAYHFVPYKSTASVGPTLIIKDTEFATYGSGIIDETLVRDWQGAMISWSSSSGWGGKALDVSEIEILPGTRVTGVGSLDNKAVGISLIK